MSSSQALILVDIQNDYFTGGFWPLADMDRVSTHASQILAAARKAGDLVIHIRHEASHDHAPFFRPGTDGAQIHNSVAPHGSEVVILKHRPNSFQDTDLHRQLQNSGIKKVTLIGAMTQMCIDATARAARDLGYEVTLIAEACGAKEQQFGATTVPAQQVQAAFLGALEMSYAKIR